MVAPASNPDTDLLTRQPPGQRRQQRAVEFARSVTDTDTLRDLPGPRVLTAGRLQLIGWGPVPEWLSRTFTRMAEAFELPAGWNSYGAQPVSFESIQSAVDLLNAAMLPRTPAPFVTPTTKGKIGLEWHTRGLNIEISPTATGSFSLYWEDLRSGKEHEGELGKDLGALRAVLRTLTERG